ncbi:hypothetical protein [Acinetobacter populi]|jgi:hypothetical protein|uniref:Uncharacterized protein n=1 Tax=Acinetobacter populi TaxID=1582270 RepID=A0A1Z9Z163_9GAMM|nr:hypothetical protein [Acinetobacter populi]MCH4248243.1 hypothetical protein [Acinetobacter populi]OUY08167.1 hypothetical protein CAP51_00660 [Acinetobacter populi]
MNIKLLTAGVIACSTLFGSAAFAADANSSQAEFEALKAEYQKSLETAAKSSDIRGGLVKACSVKYKTAVANKALTQADVNKLCSCSVTAEGQVTTAETWELQSAANAKNKTKFEQLQVSLMKKQGDSIKKCVGTDLDQKLTKLTQQAQAAAKK